MKTTKLLICLLTLVLGFCVPTFAQDVFSQSCSRATSGIGKMICHDQELSESSVKSGRLIKNARQHLSKERALVLGLIFQDWYINVSDECGVDGWPGPHKSNDAKMCLLKKFSLLDTRLRQDFSKSASEPYQLSPYELFVVAEDSDGSFMGFDYDGGMRRVLHRLVLSVIENKAKVAEFYEAISGPGPFVMPDGGRYIFGQACAGHSCNAERGAFVADTQSGDIVFAVERQDDLTIFEKACSDEALKAYSKQRFMRPWPLDETPSTSQADDSGIEINSPLSGPRTAEQTKTDTTACP